MIMDWGNCKLVWFIVNSGRNWVVWFGWVINSIRVGDFSGFFIVFGINVVKRIGLLGNRK